MDSPRVTIDVHLNESGSLATMGEDVRRGLTSTPKQLSPKYFYDERGSWLFERITELPEYYPTRAEKRLLDEVAPEVARIARPEEIVELGAGSATKTRLLLEAGRQTDDRFRRYVPFDVSEAMVEHSASELVAEYPWIEVHGVVGDFQRHLDRVPEGSNRVVALLGSTIGNFARADAVRLLRDIADLMDDDDYFLLGADLVKDRAVLEAAYNDSQGVTAEFNRNVLHVVNRRLDGDFVPEAFEHVAFYDDREERIELHLESKAQQSAHVRAIDLEVSFENGERMLTELSHKYTRGSAEAILDRAGLAIERWFTDEGKTFALCLCSRA